MSTIEKLQAHQENEMSEWFDYSDRKMEAFLAEVALFAEENPKDLKAFCQQTLPSEFSSLSIVYQALSEHSSSQGNFLLAEVKRVIDLAKDNKIEPSDLKILLDIDVELFYENDPEAFTQSLDYMADNLLLENEGPVNTELLDVLDWFLGEYFENESKASAKKWINPIVNLANNSTISVKLKAREMLEGIGVS